MPHFDSDGVKIHYEIEGEGPDLIMIHGFAANIDLNWRQPKWIDVLKGENRLILVDCRGHGKSDKPRDPEQYGTKMADDIVRLMEHLSIEKSNFFGYSMGSMITLGLLVREPQLFKSAIIGGFVLPSSADEAPGERASVIVDAFRKPSIEAVDNPVGKMFRIFAESTGSDLEVLAAIMQGSRNLRGADFINVDALKKISVPVMTVVGSNEFMPGDKTAIAQIVPRACHFQIQGRDHLTVVGDSKFHMVVKGFLNYVNSRKPRPRPAA